MSRGAAADQLARADVIVVVAGPAGASAAHVLAKCRSEPGLHRIAEEYLRYLGITELGRVERHGYFIPLRPRSEPLARNRVFLVGDAAGLVDPVTAEG